MLQAAHQRVSAAANPWTAGEVTTPKGQSQTWLLCECLATHPALACRCLPSPAGSDRCPYVAQIQSKRQACATQAAQKEPSPLQPAQGATSDGQLSAALLEACSEIPAATVQCIPPLITAQLLAAAPLWQSLGLRLRCEATRTVAIFADNGHWAC